MQRHHPTTVGTSTMTRTTMARRGATITRVSAAHKSVMTATRTTAVARMISHGMTVKPLRRMCYNNLQRLCRQR
jgi:hypothetical protein